jgi:hypothetical protein
MTDLQKIQIIKEYTESETITCLDLALKHKLNREAVRVFLKRRGIKIRKMGRDGIERKFNHSFFEKIDTEEKAYFLGLMYADGCIHKNITRLALQEDDKDILEKFLKSLEANFNLYLDNSPQKKNPKWKKRYVLSLTNKTMVKNLISVGCLYKKTKILKFPTKDQVPENLLRHFIRGYIDGDGCIYTTISKIGNIRCSLSLVSTKEFCDEFISIVLKSTNIKFSCSKTKSNNIFRLAINGRQQTEKILDWIYKDATVFLDRKYNKYLEIKTSKIFKRQY